MNLDFYRAVLPDAGTYCLFLMPERRHVWVDSLEKLAMASNKLAPRQGVYFSTATFNTPSQRTQANVLELKSLRLDIDAGAEKYAKHGEGKVYPTQAAALVDVVRFSKAIGVAPSYIISSGQGLHLYYVLTEAVRPAVWLPLAKALGKLCTAHKLLADPSVTEDTARVLRPLGSLHSEGRTVSVIKATGATYPSDSLAKKLGAVMLPERKWDTSVNDEALSSFEGPPSSALKITAHCAALREIAQAEGDVPEPQWRAMLGLVKRTVEGRDIAHEWSAGSDTYDEADTDKKFDAWATGPTTCVEFGKHTDACLSCSYRGRVKSPISLGLMTEPEIEQLPEEKRPEPPRMLEPTKTGEVWDDYIPKSFAVVKTEHGHTLMHSMKTEKNSDSGEMVPVVIQVPVTHDVFWFGQWADAAGTDDNAMLTLHKWDGNRVRSYMLDQTLLASNTDLAKFLAGKAIHLTTDKRAAKAMENYAKQQFQRIKHMAERPKITDRMGMRILDDGQLVCAHGKYVIYPDGTIHEAMLGIKVREYAEQFPLPVPVSFSGEWPTSVWDEHILPKARRHVDFMQRNYNKPGLEKYQLAFMLSLSSPLMAFVMGTYTSGAKLPPNGLTVSLYSREGGRGKSTLMQASMLAYGIPGELSKDQNESGSTDLGRIASMSLSGTMPVAMDEMGGTKDNAIAALVSSIANGSSRTGATKDGGLRSGSRWALTCLVAANKSQRDMIAASQEENSAIQWRLLELDVDRITEFGNGDRAAFAKDWAGIADCAGALGAVVHRELCALGAVKANSLIMECVNKAGELVQAEQTGRFQYRALGAMLALQMLLKRLNLAVFDLKPMVKEFREAHDSGRDFVKDNVLPTDGLQLLNMMLHDLRPNTVITEFETRLTGKSTSPPDHMLNASMPTDIRVRHVVSTRRSYVSMDTLRAWCKKRHVRDMDVLRDSVTAGVLRTRTTGPVRVTGTRGNKSSFPYNLLKGMRESTSSYVPVYEFDLRLLARLTGGEIDGIYSSDIKRPDNVPPAEDTGDRESNGF
jgi:hypothetical protein